MTAAKQYSNTRVLINKSFEGATPNKSHFRTETITIEAPELKENELFTQALSVSLDPFIRFDFSGDATESPVIGYVLSKVLDSKNPQYPVGSIIFSPAEWGQYSHISNPEHLGDVNRYDEAIKSSGLPHSLFNGILGVPAFTVWHSLKQVGDLKAGETIYISSAAGTLGQIAGQLAKRKGLRVIGSAGSQDKIDYLINELGFDAAFNYKTQDKKQALLAAGGDKGIDIYYDLVGDDTVDVALDILNPSGRIIAIGVLAMHQNELPYAPKNTINILMKQLRYEGYLVFENYQHFPQFWEEVVPLVKSGEIKFKETVIEDASVEQLGETYVNVLAGKYSGKVSVHLASL
ncbi:hypothetical protein BGZ74_002389 [Mortierella antarctica]|nr:hypothetical protein BGZ74_002389 [Mortierella antarctica]